MAFKLSLKRSVVASAAALAIAGGVVGVAGAQQATQTPNTGAQQGPAQQRQQRLDQYLSTLAGKLGVTVDKLRQSITDTNTELGLPQRGGPGLPFGGHRGPGGPGAPGGPGGFGVRGFGLDVAAQAIGITPEALRQELPGKSLADVARAHNVDPARVATALKNDANAKIDQAVSNGRLTAEQAAQAKQRAGEQVDELMTRQLPAAPQPGQPRDPGLRGPRGGQQAPQGQQGQRGQTPARPTASPTAAARA